MATPKEPITAGRSKGPFQGSLTYLHLGLSICLFMGFAGLVVVMFLWPDGRLAGAMPGFVKGAATKYYIEGFIGLFMLLVGPYVWQRNRAFSRLLDMESRFPEWLIDVAEAREAGMTLAESVYSTCRSNYGGLTKEVRRMATEISWGRSFARVLSDFAIRSRSKFIASTTYTIIAASRAGGEITHTIRAAAEAANKRQIIRKEQSAGMKQYMYMSYFSFMIFIGVVFIIYTSFLRELGSISLGGFSFSANQGSQELTDAEKLAKMAHYRFIIKMLMIESAIGGGLYAGVLEKGSVFAGLKHSVTLLILAYLGLFITFGGSIV